MPNFQNGKVYSIRSYQTNMVYIGSTTQSLAKRIGGHRCDYRKHLVGNRRYLSSYEIIKYEDNYIELIQEFKCSNKMELGRREGEIIRTTENCVNKNVAGRTPKEYNTDKFDTRKQNEKQYRIKNAESIKQHKQQYYQNNKETIDTRIQQYRIKNAESIKQRAQQYYQNNKETIYKQEKQYRIKNAESIKQHKQQYYEHNKDKLKQKVDCLCGGKYTHTGKSRHLRTAKHINYLSTLTEIPLSSDSQEPNQIPANSTEHVL
jgi:hypothetical protein